MAREACLAAAAFDEDNRDWVMFKLLDPKAKGEFYTPGEVRPRFESAVEVARQRLGEEEDPALQAFWRWRLAHAEAQLKEERERVQEEHGE